MFFYHMAWELLSIPDYTNLNKKDLVITKYENGNFYIIGFLIS